MNWLRIPLVFILFSFTPALFGQKLKKGEKEIVAALRAHIGYLADDKLEGRRAGSPGEKLAMEYIAGQFRAIGLEPRGEAGFFQAFEINEGLQIDDSTYMQFNGERLTTGRDFFPFPYSALGSLEALPAIALQESGMPWFTALDDILEDNKENPHFDVTGFIRTNAEKAKQGGASALIIYNLSEQNDNLRFNGRDRSPVMEIPVVYVSKPIAKKYFSDETATLNLKMNIRIAEKKRSGHNVIGYLDRGAPTTIIIGAHFDHLGYGEDGNSMLRTGEKLIHNGADDNASGTAAMIELAKLLKSSKSRSNNYLFLAFSGEELGLYGSKYFTDHPGIDLSTVNYMINLDMVGRLNDSTKALAIGGFGTSPTWAQVIDPNEKNLPFKIKIDSSGSGPSDHTSFYRKDIPVLFFFTGQHKDYHRPSDDAEFINYQGTMQIVQYINRLIGQLNASQNKLAFLKTREVSVGTSSFKVTMGIMPDYTYDGQGVRADGVTDGRPAAKAGLKAGDVIIQLGPHMVNSVETYMQALNKFEKGQVTTVRYKRGNETIESSVQF